MRPVQVPAGVQERRLGRLWAGAGVDPLYAVERGTAQRLARLPGLVSGLRRWAGMSRGTRAWAELPGVELVTRAAMWASARPVAFVHP
jgi:hypothetical protein